MNHIGSMLFVYTETSLHAGSGASLGAVDLPIQRERMSALPMHYHGPPVKFDWETPPEVFGPLDAEFGFL